MNYKFLWKYFLFCIDSACNNLRCTSCDFKVSIFKDFAWDPTTNYLFLRNNMPDFEKVRPKLKIKRGKTC